MRINSTHLISYNEINVDNIDLYEDAFGLYPETFDAAELLPQSIILPEPALVNRLIERIRKNE
jgi:hypothetical protein